MVKGPYKTQTRLVGEEKAAIALLNAIRAIEKACAENPNNSNPLAMLLEKPPAIQGYPPYGTILAAVGGIASAPQGDKGASTNPGPKDPIFREALITKIDALIGENFNALASKLNVVQKQRLQAVIGEDSPIKGSLRNVWRHAEQAPSRTGK